MLVGDRVEHHRLSTGFTTIVWPGSRRPSPRPSPTVVRVAARRARDPAEVNA